MENETTKQRNFCMLDLQVCRNSCKSFRSRNNKEKHRPPQQQVHGNAFGIGDWLCARIYKDELLAECMIDQERLY